MPRRFPSTARFSSSARLLAAVGSLAAALSVGFVLSGCEERPAPAGPDHVVADLLGRLRLMHGSVDAGQRVVELLWKPARDNLAERAKRASALSGREVSPGEMLAPSWLSLGLVPERFEWREDGAWAEVRAVSADGQFVPVRCARENGAWKVALELPAVPPIRQREEPTAQGRAGGLSFPRTSSRAAADVPATTR